MEIREALRRAVDALTISSAKSRCGGGTCPDYKAREAILDYLQWLDETNMLHPSDDTHSIDADDLEETINIAIRQLKNGNTQAALALAAIDMARSARVANYQTLVNAGTLSAIAETLDSIRISMEEMAARR